MAQKQSVWKQKIVIQCIVLMVGLGMNFGVNFTSITPFNGMIWIYWGNQGYYSDSDLAQGIISASLIIGAMVGSLVMSILLDKLGRRTSIGFAALLSVIFCCLSALSEIDDLNIWWLCVTRALFGFPVGFLTGAGPIYISEVSPPEIRGRLTTMIQLFITFGILVAYGIGALIENLSCDSCPTADDGGCYEYSECYGNAWLNLLLGCIWIIPVTICIWWFPESYAVSSNVQITEVVNVPIPNDVNDVNNVESSDVENKNALKTPSSHSDQLKYTQETPIVDNPMSQIGAIRSATWKEIFRDYTKCALFGFIVSMCQQLSGINAIIIYAPRIFSVGIEDENLAKILGGIGVSAWNFVTTFIGVALIDKVGRKRLLFLGFLVMSVGTLFVWIGNAFLVDVDSTASFVVMVIGLVLFLLAFEYGPGPIFYVLIGEMFPAEIKSKCAPVMNLLQWICNLLVVLLFPVLDSAMDGHVWLIFLVSNIVGTLATWFMAIETKNVPLDQIRSKMYRPRAAKV